MLNKTDLSRADLNLLVLFEAVMAAQHVGRAAEQLHISPSAVSHGLGRLRHFLNDPLFLRTPKGVVPTERAIELYFRHFGPGARGRGHGRAVRAVKVYATVYDRGARCSFCGDIACVA